ncbi:MAG: PorT family protein [Bacteroidota bacterium]|nr:PorT family protein [Bacteroidota bacterium]
MKNFLKIRFFTILSILLCTMFQLHAQETKFGFRVGGNITNAQYKQGNIDHNIKSKFGLDLAVVADFPLGDVVSIGPELHWLQKGYKLEDFNGPLFDDAVSTLNYIELPILIKLNFGEEAKFFVMGGPSFGYLLSEKTVDQDGDEIVIDLDDYNRLDLGAHLGAGLGLGPLVIDIRYLLGVSNFAKEVDDTTIHNNGFGAGISLMF